MPTIETMLDKGFGKGGKPWDSTAWRRFVLLWLCPVCAVVIGVSGGFIMHERLTADDPSGYVVSSSPECVLVIADRPDGPPVETVREASGGRFGTCGGLEENALVHYDPGEGIQVPGPDDTKVGFVAFSVFTLLAGVPGALAWTHTLQKRRARRRSASHTPGDRPRH